MKIIPSLALCALLASCTPRVFYLGGTYPSSPSAIDVLYDENQIKRPYEVIGSLTSSSTPAAQSHVQRAMIDQAKAIGADAVVFHDIDIDETDNSRVVVLKAKAVRY